MLVMDSMLEILMKKKSIKNWSKPKFKIGDKVIATYQYDMMDRTRADGIVLEVNKENDEGEFKGRFMYRVKCEENSLMNDWYLGTNLELVKKASSNYEKALWPNKAKKKKLRKVGDIMLDLEPLLFELHEDHDMQHGEVLYLINGWQKIHVPEQIETYEDGSHPVFYGPRPAENYGEKMRKKLEMQKLSSA